MGRKSLRKAKKQREKASLKESHSLHLVGGRLDHNHNITHSHTPISASEIEKLDAINPEYTKELLSIMKTTIENDRYETESFYKSVDKEQENDRREIESNFEQKTRSAKYAFSAIGILLFAGISLIIYGANIDNDLIIGTGGTTIGVVLLGVARAFLSKPSNDNNDEE